MIKNGDKKRILITQPRPETDKSPYFELAKKYDVDLEFHDRYYHPKALTETQREHMTRWYNPEGA